MIPMMSNISSEGMTSKPFAGSAKSSSGKGFLPFLQQASQGTTSLEESDGESLQGLLTAMMAAGLSMPFQGMAGELSAEGGAQGEATLQVLQERLQGVFGQAEGTPAQSLEAQNLEELTTLVNQIAGKGQKDASASTAALQETFEEVAQVLVQKTDAKIESETGSKSKGLSESRFAEILGLRSAQNASVATHSAKHPVAVQETLVGQGEAELAAGLLNPETVQGSLTVDGDQESGVFSKALDAETLHQDLPEGAKTAEILMGGQEPMAPSHQAGTPEAKGAEIRLPSGTLVGEGRIVEQTIEKLTVHNPRETSSITLRLHPEELGHVKLELVMDKDSVRAHLHAQSQQVQEVLERHLPRLRDALEMQGLKIDQLQVSVDSQQSENGGFFQQQNSQGTFTAQQGTPWSASRYEEPPAQVVATRQSVRDGSGLSVRI